MKDRYRIVFEGNTHEVQLIARNPDSIRFSYMGEEFDLSISPINGQSTDTSHSSGAAGAALDGKLRAPIPGIIAKITAESGQEVASDDTLLVLEAMKMENNLNAPCSLRVSQILVEQGDEVSEGQVLLEYELLED